MTGPQRRDAGSASPPLQTSWPSALGVGVQTCDQLQVPLLLCVENSGLSHLEHREDVRLSQRTETSSGRSLESLWLWAGLITPATEWDDNTPLLGF